MFGLFESKVKSLTMDQAKDELEKNNSIILLDVRSKEEYQSSHIKKSINVPLDQIQTATYKIADKNSKIFVYCLSGGRSKVAASYLSNAGFTDVTNIGGITDWKYELER